MGRKFAIWVSEILLKVIFWFRYKITVKNKEVLNDPRFKTGGVLVLPNHPALIDPFIVLMVLCRKFALRPLIAEEFYHYPGGYPLMKMVQAIPVPEFDLSMNEYKRKNGENFLNKVTDILTSGGRMLIYPSGMLKREAKERIGGRSMVHRLMQQFPNTNILLIRTTGLWGSMFSTAQEGKTPSMWGCMSRGFISVLKNGIFFCPRRHVTIEFGLPDKEFPLDGDRRTFNQALENWYNQYPLADGTRTESEPMNLVRYSIWSKKKPKAHQKNKVSDGLENLRVPKDIKQDILCKLSELSSMPVGKIKPEDDLLKDVGLDSIDITQIHAYIDENYELNAAVMPGDLVKVRDLYAAAMHVTKHVHRKPEQKKRRVWQIHEKRPTPEIPTGDTIPEVFLKTCERMGEVTACADANSGVLSYPTLKRAVIIFAKKLQSMKGEYIAIMLPSSVAAYIVMLACQLAGKKPVMLNWTVGKFFLDHAIDLLNIEHVFTSKKFLDKAGNLELGKVADRLVLLEDVKKGLTLMEKLKGALLAKRSSSYVLKAFRRQNTSKNETAVVLFTSGTEALPKCVELSHENVLSNQRAAFHLANLKARDCLLGALPPFHVFGSNITGLLPLLGGFRAYYSPDPLDSQQLANEIMTWKISILILAPTFFSALFRVGTLRQLRSLRLLISGAEKAQDDLIEFAHKLGEIDFLEGYGCTETSPIISVNRPGVTPHGLGQPLSNLDVRVIHPESCEELMPTQIGEIVVSGPSVFDGYVGKQKKDPFVVLNDKRYYRTGDIGRIDDKGHLYLEGRKKRFVKKGGEMLSLASIETALFNEAKEHGWIDEEENHLPFAVCAEESDHTSPKLVLFTEWDIDVEHANEILRKVGFSRLFKINSVKKLPEIPTLQSGKVSYRELDDLMKKHLDTMGN